MAILATSLADLFTLEALVALLTLTALEIVLGIDNIVFLSILSERVEEERRAKARQLGLALALGLRILLLLCIGWVMGLRETLFTVFGLGITGRDLVLLAGGLFLITKGTLEIHHLVEGHHPERAEARGGRAAFGAVLAQIAVMDLVFSLDSVITAVGMTDVIPVMIAAVVIAIVVMMVFATPIANFVQAHLPIKTLALAFLVLVGVLLVADGLHQHLPRGYVYFAMAFSLAVELLNLRAMAKRKAATGAKS
jgi:predicted tellurium resistance membrane protein TerC